MDISKTLKAVKEKTLHTIGFILHTADLHKPTSAKIMEYLDGYFWTLTVLFIISIISNFFIA